MSPNRDKLSRLSASTREGRGGRGGDRTGRERTNVRHGNILKHLLVGVAATVARVIGQIPIPAGKQSALAPSAFAQNGTMRVAFTVYGIFPIRRSLRCFCASTGG